MKSKNGDFEQAREIIRFFMRNPEVSEDLEGIARWRLMQERVYRRVDEVNRALDLLVQMELLLQDNSLACGTRYCLNPGRLKESEVFAVRKKKGRETHD